MAALSLFASVTGSHAFAAPVGAGVSWVPWDNRADFVVNRSLLDQIMEATNNSAAKPDPTFFALSPERHFRVPVDAEFESSPRHVSFVGQLDLALDSLVKATNSDPNAEPFLAIAISSHGSSTGIARQFGPDVGLRDFIDLLLFRRHSFIAQTHRHLRIEILYSACESGALIRAMKNRLREVPAEKELGPITVLTTTTEDKNSSGDLLYGNPLLRMVLQLGPGGEKVLTEAKVKMPFPSLGVLGFFRSLGAGAMNHPQIFTNLYRWSSKNVLDFLNWYSLQSSYWITPFFLDRSLRLDLDTLMDESKDISDVWDVISAAQWNKSTIEYPEILGQYLTHKIAHVRYAAALLILTRLRSPLISNLYSKAQLSGLEQYATLAEKNLFLWAQGDFISSVGEGDHLHFFWNLIEALPSDEEHQAQSIAVMSKLYEHYGKSLSRPSTELLRKIFKTNYYLGELRTEFSERPGNSRRKIERIPVELRRLFTQVYFGLPLGQADGDTLLSQIISARSEERHASHATRYCEFALKIIPADARLEELNAFAIERFDAGEPTGVYNNFMYQTF